MNDGIEDQCALSHTHTHSDGYRFSWIEYNSWGLHGVTIDPIGIHCAEQEARDTKVFAAPVDFSFLGTVALDVTGAGLENKTEIQY